ncbi:NAD-dependent epimerase/dehydratase family protein [candidate division WOR-3 bacterium]|uniref:NAD-dependent epimerase/dehydratase family protein n=1 Tax=candidate division WOR-3 bacterium TaxID=2052148 RepID=A0A9D5KAK5_UNCW3|nr:NAD-dependent epimerase/dehydratase family protein [candidate division WOR-3 bacterium]MBD3365348.1 NAD-dependent epimerase/dehydratase family protein [candidate division WOR-3 bacterium]
MNRDKVLVTGASGFLGSHICDALHEAGYEAHALVRKTSSRDWLRHDWINIHTAELDDVKGLSEILKGKYAVIHAAAALHGAADEVLEYVNVTCTKLMAEQAVKAGIRKFVFISSNAATEPGSSIYPKKEPGEDNPVSPYGMTKKRAEEVLSRYHKKMKVVNLRYVVIYGPRDKHLVRLFKLVASPVTPILGKYPIYMPSVYVKDGARAAVSALSANVPSGSTYYISDGMPYTFETLYDMIASAIGIKLRFIRIPIGLAAFFMGLVFGSKKTDVAFTAKNIRDFRNRFRLISPEKAIRELDWKPEVMAWDGFRETVQWYRDQGWL